MVNLDTNIIIDHLRKPIDESILMKISNFYDSSSLAISLITVQELYIGKSTKIDEKENALIAILSNLNILPYEYSTAVLAGRLIRDAENFLDFQDAAIAATCLENKCSLLTLNPKHFANTGIELYELDLS